VAVFPDHLVSLALPALPAITDSVEPRDRPVPAVVLVVPALEAHLAQLATLVVQDNKDVEDPLATRDALEEMVSPDVLACPDPLVDLARMPSIVLALLAVKPESTLKQLISVVIM